MKGLLSLTAMSGREQVKLSMLAVLRAYSVKLAHAAVYRDPLLILRIVPLCAG
jgi:hypothetical protein